MSRAPTIFFQNSEARTQSAARPQVLPVETETFKECREATLIMSGFPRHRRKQRRGHKSNQRSPKHTLIGCQRHIHNRRRPNSSRSVAKPKHSQRKSEAQAQSAANRPDTISGYRNVEEVSRGFTNPQRLFEAHAHSAARPHTISGDGLAKECREARTQPAEFRDPNTLSGVPPDAIGGDRTV